MNGKNVLRLAALAVIAAAGSATAAHAQNYGTYGSAFDWSGFYAGVYGGLAPSEIGSPFSDVTLQGGAVAGYNLQIGPGVIGAELEGGYLHGRSYQTSAGGELTQDWSAAAKLKAGLALDRTMLYATAGYGVARLDPQGNVSSKAAWQGGWIFGGGVEQSITSNLSAKLEYTQMRLDNVPTTVAGTNYSDDLVNHSIKAGLNFRF